MTSNPSYVDWERVQYIDFVNDIEKFKLYDIDIEKYNFNLKDEDQDYRWVHQYCYEALTKYKDETCLNIKLAAVRHIIDTQRQKQTLPTGNGQTDTFQYKFSAGHAQKVINFYKLLGHVKVTQGTFKLLPWQQFIVGSIFGWIRKDSSARAVRRFRYANVYVARKNGKSTLACGIALYMLVADGEVGADIYTTGPTGKQARIVFDDASKMLKKSQLKALGFRINRDAIICDALDAKMEYKNSIADNLDGLNSHLAVIDELHSFKNSDVYNVMRTSIGCRTNPMFFAITTAGFNIGCIGYNVYEDSKKILNNLSEMTEFDSTFCALYEIDDGDSYEDEKAWHKANPSLRSGARPKQELAEYVSTCKVQPSQRPNLITKYMNRFVQGQDKWLDKEDIDAGINRGMKLQDYIGSKVPCYIGVDIGLVSDLAAISFVFVKPNGELDMFSKAYFPMEALEDQSVTAQQIYRRWAQQNDGSFTLTGGSSCDFELLQDEIIEASRSFNVRQVSLDPWNSSQMQSKLQSLGIKAEKVSQSTGALNEPIMLFERKLLERELKFDGSGVFTWCLLNCCLKVCGQDNSLVTISKDNPNSEYKIDCVAAAVTALHGYIHEEIKKPSAFNRLGVRR